MASWTVFKNRLGLHRRGGFSLSVCDRLAPPELIEVAFAGEMLDGRAIAQSLVPSGPGFQFRATFFAGGFGENVGVAGVDQAELDCGSCR